MNLDNLIKHYYLNAPLVMSDYPRREFAFQHWNQPGPNARDRSFGSEDELREALKILSPKAVYASNALYLDPANRDKNKKDLKSTDLAFDLDFTDLPLERKSDDFWSNIEEIAKDTALLVEETLPSLGISKECLLVTFSGGKGFHVRVNGEEYRSLTKNQRRQIQEYVVGKDLSPIFTFGYSRKNQQNRKISWNMKQHGWQGHVSSACEEYFTTIIDSDMPTAMAFVKANWPYHESGKDSGKKKKCQDGTVSEIVQIIKNNPTIKNGGVIQSMFSKKTQFNYVKDSILQWAKSNHGPAIDLSVTQDLRRILRVPGSLHGKTGIPCMAISLEEVKDIEKIKQKHEDIVGSDSVEIETLNPVRTPYDTLDSGTHVLPRYRALCALACDKNS